MKHLNILLAAAERELALRKGVYPRWVNQKKLSAEKAKHEIECMADIVDLINRQKLLAEISEEMQRKLPLPFQENPPPPGQPTLI